jgi:hypothetical protein
MRLLRLYPRAWRRRYEAEMRALLEQHHVTMATHIDLLRGALDAWRYQRRYVMAPALAATAWRGARLSVIPSAFIVAEFLLELIRTDNWLVYALLTLMWPASVVALVLVCLQAGASETRRGGTWLGRLTAGASAGLVSVGLVLVVNNGLTLADVGFRISAFVLGLQGVYVSGDSFAIVASRIFATRVLVTSAALMLAGGLLGAGLAALGALLAWVHRSWTHPSTAER